MQTAGVICEYNPFHLGHARQLGLILSLIHISEPTRRS